MHYRHFFLTPLAMTCLLLGCSHHSTVPAPSETPAPAAAAPTAEPASYALEVRGENGSSQASLADNSDVTIGGFRVKIQDGQMTVNKRSYGKLKAGDSVLIESDGQVLVNLEVREPWGEQGR